VHQVGDQPRLYLDAWSTNYQETNQTSRRHISQDPIFQSLIFSEYCFCFSINKTLYLFYVFYATLLRVSALNISHRQVAAVSNETRHTRSMQLCLSDTNSNSWLINIHNGVLSAGVLLFCWSNAPLIRDALLWFVCYCTDVDSVRPIVRYASVAARVEVVAG
jgi:hypothetical protein